MLIKSSIKYDKGKKNEQLIFVSVILLHICSIPYLNKDLIKMPISSDKELN